MIAVEMGDQDRRYGVGIDLSILRIATIEEAPQSIRTFPAGRSR